MAGLFSSTKDDKKEGKKIDYFNLGVKMGKEDAKADNKKESDKSDSSDSKDDEKK